MKFNRRHFLISLSSGLGLAFYSYQNLQQIPTTNVKEINSRITRTSNGEHSAEEKYLLSLLGICEQWVNENYEVYPIHLQKDLKKIHHEILELCEY